MKLHLPLFLRKSLLVCLSAVAACTVGSASAWAEPQNLTFGDSSLTWDAQGDSFVNEAGEAAAFAEGDNVSFTGESIVTLGENITAGTLDIAAGADVTIDLGNYTLNADTISLSGTLNVGDSLSIASGSTLAVQNDAAVLESNLVLGEKSALAVDAAASLNNNTLTLQGGSNLILTAAGDGKTYTLFTGVSGLVDAEGNAITLDFTNNAIANYFDTTRPGTGFWAGATLVLNDGALQLVRHNETVKEVVTITTRQTSGTDYQYYAGVTFEWISTTSDGGAIYGDTITLSDNGSVTFIGNTASGSAEAYGGAIDSPAVTMTGNGDVSFSGNTASASSSAYGGAIYGYDDITLSDNGNVVFEENTASSSDYSACGGAICGSVTMTGNGSVVFEGNTASSSEAYGGAIYGYGGSTITLSDNGSVTFSGNTASSSDDYACGGAIYRSVTMTGNGDVSFSGNTASSSDYYASGGAIDGSVTMERNGSVTFIGNTASGSFSALGGAIEGSVTMTGNGDVSFSGNTAESSSSVACGGAICFSVTMTGNGSVTFIGNTASGSSYARGGAIYGDAIYDSVTMTGNGSVTFIGNTASGSTYAYGGAIYTDGYLNIRNNDSVEFSQNAEVVNGNTYRLRSIYADGGSGDEISLSAAEGKSITFYDSVYIGSGATVNLNADYTYQAEDDTSVTIKQQGDIIFTGATTVGDLYTVKGNVAGTEEEIRLSRTTEVNALTNLYGGRLRVEDGAICQGQGITAMEGSAATVRVQNATLSHSGYDLTFNAGTTLELAGNNTIAGALQMLGGSSLVFDNTHGNGTTDIIGSLGFGSDVSLALGNQAYGSNEVLLYVSDAVSGWDAANLTVQGNSYTTDSFTWVDNLLVLNYDESSFNRYFNGSVNYNERLVGDVIRHHYESVSFTVETSSPQGGAIYGAGSAVILLSDNESVTFSGNTASGSSNADGGAIHGNSIMLSKNGSVSFSGNTSSASSDISAYGGAIYGGSNSTITLSNNGSVTFSGNTASSTASAAYGGAIYTYGDLSIRNNDSVLFEKNAEVSNGTYRLRSIYADGGSDTVTSLSAAADKSIEFRDSVYIDSGSTMNMNQDYTYQDEDGNSVTVKQTGDIIFTGKYTETHLNEILDADGLNRTAKKSEIYISRTTLVNAMTNLYGGRLCVEDGAIYQGQGITAHAGSQSTVLVKDAALLHAGYDLTFNAGTTLELAGTSTITGNVQLLAGSTLEFNAVDPMGGSFIRGNLSFGDALTIAVLDTGLWENHILLYTEGNVTGWNENNITIQGSAVNNLTWVNGCLVLNYHDETFNLDTNFKGDYAYVERVTSTGDVYISHYNNVTFCGLATYKEAGGAIRASGNVSISGNGNVVFTENFSYANVYNDGGAIRAFGNVSISGNGDVIFSGNCLCTSSAYDTCGGAVSAKNVSISGNGEVKFSGNYTTSSSRESDGGAVFAENVSISGNGDVSFSGNTASAYMGSYGGAIYGGWAGSPTVSIIGNGDVSFSENAAISSSAHGYAYDGSCGGAISNSYGTVSIIGNGDVSFSENAAISSSAHGYAYDGSCGGAIYTFDGTVSIIGNGDVSFSENAAISSSAPGSAFDGSYGGAIYTSSGTVSISGNDTVCFEKNYESDNSTYRLRSIYADGGGLNLSAKSGGHITFYDSVYAGTTSLNADYTDEDGNPQQAKGDIIFSGQYTKAHLDAILEANNEGRVATEEEILNSRTSILGKTTLYGGSLQVVDGAIYQGQGIMVHEGSGATVRVKDATLSHSGYDLTFNAGTTLELAGSNTITGNVQMLEGSTMRLIDATVNGAEIPLSFKAGTTLELAGTNSITGNVQMLEGSTMRLKDATVNGAEIPLTFKAGTTLELAGTNSITGNVQMLEGSWLAFDGSENKGMTWLTGNLAFNGGANVSLSSNTDWSGQNEILLYVDGSYTGWDESTLSIRNGESSSADLRLVNGDLLVLNYNAETFKPYFKGDVVCSDRHATAINNRYYNRISHIGTSITEDYGGAIEGGTVEILYNNGVQYSDNSVSVESGRACGGAIYGSDIEVGNNEFIVFSGNVVYSGATYSSLGTGAFGGAIKGGIISLHDNESIEFTGNEATSTCYSSGGALDTDSSIQLINNGSVCFERNKASGAFAVHGGAIYGFGGTEISLIGNDALSFIGNTANSSTSAYGGAIVGDGGSDITLSRNGVVTFHGNKVVSSALDSAVARGGAIYMAGRLNICNNDSVVFSGNVEDANGVYRLRSIYGKSVSLSAAAGKSIEFHDSIYIGSGASVNLNANYGDIKQQGDILFTGATTEADLYEVKGNVAGTEEEIRLSRTTEVNALTHLYGGRLRVEDGAIYQGQGITAHEGSDAVVRVKDAELSHIGHHLEFQAGTALEVAGNSTIRGNVNLKEGSLFKLEKAASLSLYETLEADAATLTVNGGALLEGGATLNASLTLADGATLDMTGLEAGAVTLSGALTFGGQVELGENLLASVESLGYGEMLNLFTGVSAVTVGTDELGSAQVQAGTVFSNVDNANVYVEFRMSGDVGSLLVVNIPEPTTSTLSLLALAALAARRRRK